MKLIIITHLETVPGEVPWGGKYINVWVDNHTTYAEEDNKVCIGYLNSGIS